MIRITLSLIKKGSSEWSKVQNCVENRASPQIANAAKTFSPDISLDKKYR